MNNKRKKVKRGLAERLACDHDIPPEVVCGGCFVELRGRNRVTVRGCRRIIHYSPGKVVLKMRKDALQICGKRLSCITYLAGSISVEGLIDSVSFLREQTENEVS